jgi:hypothetical protein
MPQRSLRRSLPSRSWKNAIEFTPRGGVVEILVTLPTHAASTEEREDG